MGINEILPGCEGYEAYHTPRFHRGMKANLNEFGTIICVHDETETDCYSPREHPSFGFIKKGERFKFKELSFNYFTLRCVTEEGHHIAIYDCVGNFIVQKITRRNIINRWEENSIVMYEMVFYIDRYGNKWALIDDKDNLILIETGEDRIFWLVDYVDKAEDSQNEFTQQDYNRWRDSELQIRKPLYYWNAELMPARGE